MMAEVQRTVAVRVELVATDTGLWCARCLLSSGVRAWVGVALGDRMHLQERLHCRGCGSGSYVVNDRT